jgi:inosine-uridine nucleoside N-ribohydrolase
MAPAMSRPIRWLLGTVIALLALFLLTLALPVESWRTGRTPVPALTMLPPDALPVMPRRIWIDTDAACGHSKITDVDDCLAILALATREDVEIAGISTVFGNAELEVTDRITRELIKQLRADGRKVPVVYTGAAQEWGELEGAQRLPAITALRRALLDAPLTIVALGPVTNIALTLHERPDLRARVSGVVAIMGRRRGHLFHPAEGASGGMLFGHGPVFVDFNFAKDPDAVARLLETSLPLVLVPYDAARHVEVTAADLEAMSRRGGAYAWVAHASRVWLAFWQDQIGREGFYPFDLMGALYVVEPQAFRCALVQARVNRDPLLLAAWRDREALLVSQGADAPGRKAAYCPDVSASAAALIEQLLR